MRKGNILIVDDTKANLELLEETLYEEGYDVRTSISGQMALRSIEALKPDLILLDIMMPGMDGYETCAKIKEIPKTNDVPIIFLSAKGESHDKIRGFELGGVDYLTKPFDVPELLARIHTHMSLYLLKNELNQKMEIIDKYVIVSSTDTEGYITDVSQAFCDISGFTKEELLAHKHNILRVPEVPTLLYDELWGTISSGKQWKGEIENQNKNGEHYWVESIISPNFDLNKNITGYTSIRHDISDKKRIEMLSITDQLTRLYNRHYFNEVFPVEIHRALRHGYCLSFAMLDIDFFKQYNDTYGHQAGDKVLEAVGKVLHTELHRAEDFAFRLGGEEFGLILNTQSCEGTYYKVDAIRRAIEDVQLEHSKSQVSSYVTVSIGVACIDFATCQDKNITMDNFYSWADSALYEAKATGRNLVSIKEQTTE